jgi:hypothetical protein
MGSAFQMIEDAYQAMGGPANSPPNTGDIWWFPDAETQDLVARIFGDLKSPKDPNYERIKSKCDFSHKQKDNT